VSRARKPQDAQGKSTVAERLEWVYGPANADLTATERALLAYIAFRDGDGGCWGALESLAAATGLSESTVRRAVRVLEGAFRFESTPLVQVPIATRPRRIQRRGNRWVTCRQPVDNRVYNSAGGCHHDTPRGVMVTDHPVTVTGTPFAGVSPRHPEHLKRDDERASPRPVPAHAGRVDAEVGEQGELLLPRVIAGGTDHRQAIAAIRRQLDGEHRERGVS